MTEWKPLLLLVEDDKVLAKLNARLLARQGYRVQVAHTVAEARSIIASSLPDLFVLDIELPDGSGLSLCEELRKQSDAPVMFLTGRVETKDKIKGLDTGGDYYLTKPYDKNELLAVIQSLLRREGRMREKVNGSAAVAKGSLELRLDERKAYVSGRDAGLTVREFDILLMLVQNEDIELSAEAIYTKVWGMSMYHDPNAIRQAISHIRKKLGEENAVDFAIFTKYGSGYVFTRL